MGRRCVKRGCGRMCQRGVACVTRACQQRRPFLAGEASRGVPGRGAYPERVRGLLEFPVVPLALAAVRVGHGVRPAAEARAHGRGRVPARLVSSPVFSRASFDAVPKKKKNVPSVDEPTAVDAARDSSRAVASSRALPARWAGSTSGTRP
jgi:hypothetical protein